MKRELLVPLVVMVFLGIGCKTTVKQRVENGSVIPLDMVINVKDGKGMQKATHPIGEIPAEGNAVKTFDVHNGHRFQLYASKAGAVVYKSPEVEVTGKVDPFEPPVIVAKPTCRILDDTLAFNTISKSFRDLGPDIGAQPITLKNALATIIGGLVVAIPGDANSARKGEIIKPITPKELKVKVMTLQDVEFPDTLETQTVVISGSASLEANAKYGPIAHFGLNLSKESTYELNWTLKGYGQINKIEDPSMKPDERIDMLPQQTKRQIKALVKENPGARIYYINRAYVLKDATMKIKEGKAVRGGSELDAASVLTLKGAVTFKESREDIKSYNDVVLNYYGSEWKLIESGPLGFGGKKEEEYSLISTGKSAWFKAAEAR